MIWTSYFSGRAPAQRKVSIARKCPRGFKGLHILELAPDNPWAGGDWRARYQAELAARFPDPEALRRLLAGIEAQVPNPVLCCYERDPGECHRRILAAFCRRHLRLDIPEWMAQQQLVLG